jgi:rRNA processing protein Krr1/Pno1
MPVDYDQLWVPGSVRIRASAPDPYAGLKGRDYIKARGLGVGHVQRLDAFDKTAVVQRFDTEQRAAATEEVASNLIPKLGRIAAASRRRRLFIVPVPKREKAR